MPSFVHDESSQSIRLWLRVLASQRRSADRPALPKPDPPAADPFLARLADAFSTEDLIAQGRCPPHGVRFVLRCGYRGSVFSPEAAAHDLARAVLRSDAAEVHIPELAVENPAGTGRFTDVRGVLEDARRGLEQALDFAGQRGSPQGQHILSSLDRFMSGQQGFTLVLDDPVGLSDIEDLPGDDPPPPTPPTPVRHFAAASSKHTDISLCKQQYQRSWHQNESLGLDQPAFTVSAQSSSIAALAQLVAKASRIVVFTGAGISTESKIPAFRSPEDDSKKETIWKRFDPADCQYSRILHSEDVRRRYWMAVTDIFESISRAEPNDAHKFVAWLHTIGKLSLVVTQNIDCLHQKAGLPEEAIVELHGNCWKVRCFGECRQLFDRMQFHESYSALRKQGKSDPPVCPTCGGITKPAEISFGEPVPQEGIRRAREACDECDLMIVIGSSLVVAPANSLPGIALHNGAPLAVLNLSPTQYDEYAAVLIKEPCGVALKQTKHILESSPS